eukprot:5708013-Prymnesium_polylepis.1
MPRRCHTRPCPRLTTGTRRYRQPIPESCRESAGSSRIGCRRPRRSQWSRGGFGSRAMHLLRRARSCRSSRCPLEKVELIVALLAGTDVRGAGNGKLGGGDGGKGDCVPCAPKGLTSARASRRLPPGSTIVTTEPAMVVSHATVNGPCVAVAVALPHRSIPVDVDGEPTVEPTHTSNVARKRWQQSYRLKTSTPLTIEPCSIAMESHGSAS